MNRLVTTLESETTVNLVNILIVDDEPKNLTVLDTVLDDPGYRLVRATSGEEALLALMAEEFAVLILDVRMPGMTGFELAQMVKERRKTARVPIIFLTAYYNEDQHILEGYGTGAVDYLHKPVNPAVLRSKVAIFAELHRKGRALESANRALLAEVNERRLAEARLNELNETLDRRVKERTLALQQTDAELRHAHRRKDEFLATLAHELRNPLAPVRNAVEVLRMKGQDTPEAMWASALIERQVRAMSRLIDELMDVSRINQGLIELRPEEVELTEVLALAVEAAQPLIGEYRHRLSLRLLDKEIIIHADATRLAQAFTNLLNNAAKYMDANGQIQISVRIDEDVVEVAIKDEGIGISADRLVAVFEMFSQVESAISRSRGGLGIGLAITQQLIAMHDGTVEARSEGLGLGSEFIVRLPVAKIGGARSSKHSTTLTEKTRSFPQAAIAPMRIIVADDNRDAACTLAALMEVMGHDVKNVPDGADAVALAETFCPHLVLLDIGMPGMNGYDACRAIRALSGGKTMLIAAITGWGQPDDRRRSKEAGFDRHLVKPVDPDLLNELIELAGAALKTRADSQ